MKKNFLRDMPDISIRTPLIGQAWQQPNTYSHVAMDRLRHDR